MTKRRSTMVLQGLTVLTGIAALVFLLWEPHVEGRNAHATLYEIYFEDRFLACAYVASTPFFVALCQAFKLLGDVGRGDVILSRSLKQLRTMKICGLAILVCVALGEAYLVMFVRGEDDIAGGVFMGVLVALVAAAIYAGAVALQRSLEARMPEHAPQS